MKVYVGADHRGFQLRRKLIDYLKSAGYEVIDDGDEQLDPADDYPVFAGRVVADMLASDDDDPRGILICGSGQGMCIAANRYKGIRACLGYRRESIQSARNDDDCNVLCMPANEVSEGDAKVFAETFLSIPFSEAPRHVRRRQELDRLG